MKGNIINIKDIKYLLKKFKTIKNTISVERDKLRRAHLKIEDALG